MFGDEDIPEMMADFGIDVTIGLVTAKGLYRRITAEVLESVGSSAPVEQLVETVLVQRGVFPELAQDVAVELTGEGIEGGPIVQFVARRLDDEEASLVRVYLERA